MIVPIVVGMVVIGASAHAAAGTKISEDDLPDALQAQAEEWKGETWYFNSVDGTYTAILATSSGGSGVYSQSEYTYQADGTPVKNTTNYTGQSQDKGTLLDKVGAAVTVVVGWIIYGFVYVFGHLLTFIIFVFIEVIQFNNFIDVPTVVTGWVIVRDLCNMFFVLILLFIAFATILRLPNYAINRTLPKLILMAVLINFSRTIFGLVIDFSQVVMLTFVNSFSQLGSNDFINMFSVDEFLSFSGALGNVESFGVLATLGALIAGGIALLVTLVVMLVLVAVIVMRIVLLWIYVILSPLVFLGRAFPGAQQYTERIWGDFIKQVMVGPLLAFFVWLALATTQQSSDNLLLNKDRANTQLNSLSTGLDRLGDAKKQDVGALSGIFSAGPFQQYIIMIGLLIGGLMVTQQVGGAAGAMAGKGLNAIQKGKGGALRLGKGTAKLAGGATARTGLTWGGRIVGGTGSILKNVGFDNVGTGLQKVGQFSKKVSTDWGQSVKDSWRDAALDKMKKAGMDSGSMEALKTVMNHRWFFKKGKEGVSEDREKQIHKEIKAGNNFAEGSYKYEHDQASGNWQKKDTNDNPIGDPVTGEKLKESFYNKDKSGALKWGGGLGAATGAVAGFAAGGPIGALSLAAVLGAGGAIAKRLAFDTRQAIARGAGKGAKDIENAKKNVKQAATDGTFMQDASAGDFDKEFFKKLADGSSDSSAAVNMIADWVGGKNKFDPNSPQFQYSPFDPNNGKQVAKLRSFAKNIAKAGNSDVDITVFKPFIDEIGKQVPAVTSSTAHKEQLESIDSYKTKVGSFRTSGKQGLVGSGALQVNTFAGNASNKDGEKKGDTGKNIIGINFNELKQSGFLQNEADTQREGAYISGEDNINKLVPIMRQQITSETKSAQEELEHITQARDYATSRRNSGALTQDEYEELAQRYDHQEKDIQGRLDDLQRAQSRLDEEKFDDMILVNTASKNFGMNERLITVAHEQAHAGGLEDEDITEHIAEGLRNARISIARKEDNGEYAAVALGRMAAQWLKDGRQGDEVKKLIDKEIERRSGSRERVQDVVQKERGEQPTDTEMAKTDSVDGARTDEAEGGQSDEVADADKAAIAELPEFEELAKNLRLLTKQQADAIKQQKELSATDRKQWNSLQQSLIQLSFAMESSQSKDNKLQKTLQSGINALADNPTPLEVELVARNIQNAVAPPNKSKANEANNKNNQKS